MGKTFKSVDEVLDFAIAREIEATEFYTTLAGRMDAPAMRQAFEDFAREEEGHRARLEAVKRGEYSFGAGARRVQGLGLAEYLVDGTILDDLSYAEALVLAMKREKAAYKLYMDLAAAAQTESLKSLFVSLADQEARHKLRFEIEYDDCVLKEG